MTSGQRRVGVFLCVLYLVCAQLLWTKVGCSGSGESSVPAAYMPSASSERSEDSTLSSVREVPTPEETTPSTAPLDKEETTSSLVAALNGTTVNEVTSDPSSPSQPEVTSRGLVAVAPIPTQSSVTTDPLVPTQPVKKCFKKAFGWDKPVRTCVATEFGCFETERNRWGYAQTDVKLGCLKSACKPLYNENVVRECCNTHLCNDLHSSNRSTLFRPTVPPLSEYVKISGSGGRIDCYDDTVGPNQRPRCWSEYGCYRLYFFNNSAEDPLKINTFIKRACIPTHDFKLCAREGLKLNSYFAECCYNNHKCNYYQRGDFVYTRDLKGGTPSGTGTDTDLTDEHPTNFLRNSDGLVNIVGGILGAIGVGVIVVLVAVSIIVARYRVKQPEPAAPARHQRPFYLPPNVGPFESVTITLPIEQIH